MAFPFFCSSVDFGRKTDGFKLRLPSFKFLGTPVYRGCKFADLTLFAGLELKNKHPWIQSWTKSRKKLVKFWIQGRTQGGGAGSAPPPPPQEMHKVKMMLV